MVQKAGSSSSKVRRATGSLSHCQVGGQAVTLQRQCSLFGVAPITQPGLHDIWDKECGPPPPSCEGLLSIGSATSDLTPMCFLGRGLWKESGCDVLTGPPTHLQPLAPMPEETSLKSGRAPPPRWWSRPRGG